MRGASRSNTCGTLGRFRKGLQPAVLDRSSAACKPQVVRRVGDLPVVGQSKVRRKRQRSRTPKVVRGASENSLLVPRGRVSSPREDRLVETEAGASQRELLRQEEALDSVASGDAVALQCAGSLRSVRPTAAETYGCGANTALGCRRCGAAVCPAYAKAKILHS